MKDLMKPKIIRRLSIVTFIFVAIIFFNYLYDKPSSNEHTQKQRAEDMAYIDANLSSYQHTEGFINLQKWTNDNGVDVYFVQVPQLPMVDIQLVFDAGTARNEDDRPLAYLSNTLLAEGTAEHSADSVAEQFETIGAQFGQQTTQDMGIVSLRTLTDKDILEKAVALFSEVVAKPLYATDNVQREIQNTITAIKYEQQKPDKIMQKAFYQAIYPNGPYQHAAIGTVDSVQKVQSEDLQAFHDKYYVQENVSVVMVGDLSLEQADQISKDVIQHLKKGEKPTVLCNVEPAQNKHQHIRFDSEQTHMILGMPLLARNDPDYYNIVVANHILGLNSQSNRIFEKVRGEAGLAYSAYSLVSPMKVKGPFMVSLQTQKDNAKKAKKLVEKIISEFIEEGPSQEELEDAKKNIIGGFPLRFDSNDSIADQVTYLAFYQLPINYFQQYQQAVEAMKLEDLKATIQNRFDLKQMTWITVGAEL